MSNERDELALILVNTQRARYDLPPRETTEYCSETCWAETDAILAAGYRKPRTITTAEELDALPVGVVILDSYSDTCRKNQYGSWQSFDEPDETYSTRSIEGCLPATVLYEPEAQP